MCAPMRKIFINDFGRLRSGWRVLLFVFGPSMVRAVTHLDVSAAQCERAAQIIAELI